MSRISIYSQTNVKRASILLFTLSLLCLSYYLYGADLRIGAYGLVDSLNYGFFLAVSLLTISSVLLTIYDNRSRILPAATFTLCMVLNALPYILEKTPRFTYTYLTYGYTDYIIRYGHSNNELFTYMNWPGLMLYGAALNILTGLSGIQIIPLTQALIKLLIVALVFQIILALSKNRTCAWSGVIIYLLGDYTAQVYYTPPALGLLLYLMVIYIIFSSIFDVGGNGRKYSAILVMLFSSITVAHLLSSVAALFVISVVFVALSISKKYNTDGERIVNNFSGLYIGIFFVVLVLWLISFMDSYLYRNLPLFLQGMMNPTSIVYSTKQMVYTGQAHSELMNIKMAYTIIYALLALGGICYALYRKKDRYSLGTILPILVILSSAVLIPLVMGSYNGEIISRALLFTSPFLAYFIARPLDNKAWRALVVILLIAAPLPYFVSAFGNEKFDYVSEQEMAGVEHFYETKSPFDYLVSLDPRTVFYQNIEEVGWKQMDIGSLDDPAGFAGNNTGYVALSDRDVQGFNFMSAPVSETALRNCLDEYGGRIYTSESFSLYYNNNTMDGYG